MRHRRLKRKLRRNPEARDIEYVLYMINMAIGTNTPLDIRDLMFLKTFIEALQEQKERPTENVKDRAWRAAIYRRFLEDPEALHQFAEQAIKKFGIENLSRMVVPEIQQQVMEQHVRDMTTTELVQLLKSHDRLIDVLDYLIEQQPDFVEERMQAIQYNSERQEDDIDEDDDDEDTAYDEEEEEGYQDRRYY